jgi:hypothetical protein
MDPSQKPKLAVWKFSSYDGCQLSLAKAVEKPGHPGAARRSLRRLSGGGVHLYTSMPSSSGVVSRVSSATTTLASPVQPTSSS